MVTLSVQKKYLRSANCEVAVIYFFERNHCTISDEFALRVDGFQEYTIRAFARVYIRIPCCHGTKPLVNPLDRYATFFWPGSGGVAKGSLFLC